MKDKLKLLILAVTIGLVALVLFWFHFLSQRSTANEETPTQSIQVAVAEKETFQHTVNADAVIFPRDQAAIVPKISAPIKKIYVNRGDRVRAGQLLAELENQDLASVVAESRGGYQQAEAIYYSAIQKAQQDLQVAKEELESKGKLYENRQFLYKEGAVSARDVEDARIGLTQAQNRYELAQKRFDLKAAKGQLLTASGKVASALAQLNYTKIVSPIDGVVIDRPFYPGETPAGSPLITVMDLSQVVARARISQEDSAWLRVGDAATILSTARDDLPGKVILVGPALEPSSTTVEVWVLGLNPGEWLKPGAVTRVGIVDQTVPNAVVIPASALLVAPYGATSVIVLDSDDKPRKQPVKVGIRNPDHLQITEGLKGGERVVTEGAFALYKEDPNLFAKTKIQIEAPTTQRDALGSRKQ
jgi:HlyD family secretion protein